MSIRILASGAIVVISLIGCAPKDAQPVGTSTKELEEKLAALEERLDEAELDIGVLELARAHERTANQSVAFDPSDGSFQRIDAKDGYGSFAVSVQDIKSFGDGVRVTLNLGNPWFVTYSNVKLNIKYGTRMPGIDVPNYAETFSAWQKALKNKEEAVLKEIQPGSWNPVTVTLPGIKADEFGYIEVSVATSTISLRR